MTAERSPKTVRLTTALLLVATFAAGSFTGAAIYRFAAPRTFEHGPPPPGMLPFERLGLSAEQHDKARAIMERYRPELDAVMRESFPKVRAIQERMEKELDGILTPEQRKLAEQLQKERPRRGPPMGGPGMGGPGMGPPPDAPPGMFPPPGMPPPPDMPPPADMRPPPGAPSAPGNSPNP